MEEEENIINENESEIYLQFKRGSFDGDGSNWSFRLGGGDKDTIITAAIKDDIFLEKVKLGAIRPNYRDLLKVKLRITQKMKNEELLSPLYEIIRVLQYNEAPKQLDIFNKNESQNND